MTPRVVTIDPGEQVIAVGETLALTAAAFDRHLESIGARATQWRSQNTAVATVDPVSGVVTGITLGMATIEATVEGKTASATVRLADPALLHARTERELVHRVANEAVRERPVGPVRAGLVGGVVRGWDELRVRSRGLQNERDRRKRRDAHHRRTVGRE